MRLPWRTAGGHGGLVDNLNEDQNNVAPVLRRHVEMSGMDELIEKKSLNRKMRIAFFLGRFSTISETFILAQILGLIDRGHEVDIYAERPGRPGSAARRR